MENIQKKETEAQKRATRKYKNSKWRPNVFIDKNKQPVIEERIAEYGCKSFNEYIAILIEKDTGIQIQKEKR